jgi:murein DD-endopeptidase MepM/ murein hydrolase activator NlpD
MDRLTLPRPVRPGGRRIAGLDTRRFTPTGIGLFAIALVLAVAPVAEGEVARNGGTEYFGHVFPVAAPHWTRGAIGGFGAPRSGGRTHEGFDIVARCGAPLVAVRGGRVRRTGYDPVLYGNYVLLHGAGERRSYFYAHLRRPLAVHRGDRLFTGQRIGRVGETGNARTVGCHLHFEVHVNGRPVDPEPYLRDWNAWS